MGKENTCGDRVEAAGQHVWFHMALAVSLPATNGDGSLFEGSAVVIPEIRHYSTCTQNDSTVCVCCVLETILQGYRKACLISSTNGHWAERDTVDTHTSRACWVLRASGEPDSSPPPPLPPVHIQPVCRAQAPAVGQAWLYEGII